jgi:ubiquitin-like modifier-activating enzyme 5
MNKKINCQLKMNNEIEKEEIKNIEDEEEIKKEIERLQLKLKKIQIRDKIEKMSSEVTDENPYSRLMALKRMGIVENYENIRKYSVAIVGI